MRRLPGLAVWLLSITPYGVYVEASYLNEFIGSNYFGALLQALLRRIPAYSDLSFE